MKRKRISIETPETVQHHSKTEYLPEFWNICGTIIIDYVDDVDVNNIIETVDPLIANGMRQYWIKNRSSCNQNQTDKFSDIFKDYIPNYFNREWGVGESDRGDIKICCMNIKQDLSNIDLNEYCKAFWYKSLPKGLLLGGKYGYDVNTFIFDKDEEIKQYSPKRRHGAYSVDARDINTNSNYTWNLLEQYAENDDNISMNTIATHIEKITSEWCKKTRCPNLWDSEAVKKVDKDKTKRIEYIMDALNKILLTNLRIPWKYILVNGKRYEKEIRSGGPGDEYIADAIDLWWFFDVNTGKENEFEPPCKKRQLDDGGKEIEKCFCKAIMIRFRRDWEDTDY